MTAEATKLLSELDRLRKDNIKLVESHDELLGMVENLFYCQEPYIYPVYQERIKKAQALKKEMFEESLPYK